MIFSSKFKDQLKKTVNRIKSGPSPFSESFAPQNYTMPKPELKKAPVENTAKQTKQTYKESLIKKREKLQDQSRKEVEEATLLYSTIALGAKMATVDGKANHKEIQSFKTVFPKTRDPKLQTSELFGSACNDNVSFEHYALRVKKYFPSQKQIYKDLLLSLMNFGTVDGPLNIEEINFLKKLNTIFELGDDYFYEIIQNSLIPFGTNPFRILEVDENAEPNEIKQSYREKIQEYHPDTLPRDIDARLAKIIHARFNKIQTAYVRVKKIRNIK